MTYGTIPPGSGMGKRGPQRTPNEILRLRGSKRGNRDGVEASGTPDAPASLSPEAAAIWSDLVPRLATMGVVACVDASVLARYCTMLARWQRLSAWIDTNGETHTDIDGKVCAYPQVAIAQRYSELLLRIEQSFGMTASSRSSIAPKKPHGDRDADADYFTGRTA